MRSAQILSSSKRIAKLFMAWYLAGFMQNGF